MRRMFAFMRDTARSRAAGAMRPGSLRQAPGGRRMAASYGRGPVSVELFRDDDLGYAAWLAANGRGYVVNIQRTLNPSDARVHCAGCRTITGTPPRGTTWTGSYVKACSVSLPDLDAWALAHVRRDITRCGTCRPPAASSAAS